MRLRAVVNGGGGNFAPIRNPFAAAHPHSTVAPKASVTRNPRLSVNPQFDPRIYNVHGLTNTRVGSGLQRGYIIEDLPDKSGHRYGVNYLYNPAVVTANHQVDLDIVKVSNKNDQGRIFGTLQGSANFSLLFDRTYETWDSKYKNTEVGDLGVYVDVNAFYNLLGISGGVILSHVRNGNFRNAALAPIAPMVYTPVRVYTGGPVRYYGMIQNITVTYTHFTQNLVPNRCSIDVGIGLITDSLTTEAALQSRAAADFSALIGL